MLHAAPLAGPTMQNGDVWNAQAIPDSALNVVGSPITPILYTKLRDGWGRIGGRHGFGMLGLLYVLGMVPSLVPSMKCLWIDWSRGLSP